MTGLYLLDCDCLKDGALFAKYYSLADGERRRKVDKAADEGARRLSLGAFAALYVALLQRGISWGQWRTQAGGKPYFVGSGVHFSLSHSGRYALCALGSDPVGCDIQRIRQVEERTVRRVLCDEEWRHYMSLSDGRERFFFGAWTVKESFLKLTGQGLGGGLARVCAPLCMGESLRYDGAPAGVSVRQYDGTEGYAAACCTRGICPDLSDITPLVCGGVGHRIKATD